MLGTTGAERSVLVPLILATIENWAASGAPDALTGPIVRGDEATVARQRGAVAERAPELLPLFDALCERTRVIAAKSSMSGPLSGIRVVEVAALGAVPHAAMMLADAGADVLRIDRLGADNVAADLVDAVGGEMQ